MATLTPPAPGADAEQRPPAPKEEQPYVETARSRHTGLKVLAALVVFGVLFALFKDSQTLALGFQETNGFQDWLNRVRDWLQLNGPGSWFFGGVLGGIGSALSAVVTFFQELFSIPAFPRPVPQVGWLGVVALGGWVAWVAAGLRSTVLVVVSLMVFGIAGFWGDSIDLLIVTGVAVVLCVLIGLPIGIAMARSARVSGAITPLLDGMQTLPAFAYLAPTALFFGIGPSTAVVMTVIYALPPLVRIAELGIRSVPPTTVEAARSMGLTSTQMLRRVELPMARRTIVLGINQCTLAALSIATIAALVNGPGLGGPVQAGLQSQNIGQAAIPGLLIVLMAIMLDRTTTAAGERSEVAGRSASSGGAKRGRWTRLTSRGRWVGRAVLLVPVLVAIYLSRTYLGLAQFPTREQWPFIKPVDGPTLIKLVNDFSAWLIDKIDTVTLAIKNDVTDAVLNPFQSLLADSPWWLMAALLLVLAYLFGGWRPAVVTLVCEGIILGIGLWNDSMVTLAMTLEATVLVMVLAVVVGVAIGRSHRLDVVVRPFLDAFQTIPPFVYLVPALALFGVGRFTAVIAAIAYASPIAIKLVADGIRGVPSTTIEAVGSTGTTAWQTITKVQLPMAREALVLATNQGLLYVLSMVVIGGLVGGGSLGYIVVSGFSQDQLFGKGLAAGIAITAIGVMLDRIARNAAARSGR